MHIQTDPLPRRCFVTVPTNWQWVRHGGEGFGVESKRLGREESRRRHGIADALTLELTTSFAMLGNQICTVKAELLKRRSVEAAMLSHCANPQCSKPFLRLGQGKLFLVESDGVAKSGELRAAPSPSMRFPARRVERYWLCDDCALVLTLVHDRGQGIVLVPLREPPAAAKVAMVEE
jgi:hypothetical protein